MSSLTRLLLIWLMALALPVQGFAAAAGRHCAAGHERAQVATVVAATGSEAVQRAHDGYQAMHGHAAADAGHHSDAAPDGGKASPLTADTTKCSACAACCAALALPAGPIVLPAPVLGTAVALPAVVAAASFVPGGLDRPPRALAA